MGGVIIVLAARLGYLMGHVGTSITFTRAGLVAILVIIASGILGFVDDYLAIRNARNFIGRVLMSASCQTRASSRPRTRHESSSPTRA